MEPLSLFPSLRKVNLIGNLLIRKDRGSFLSCLAVRSFFYLRRCVFVRLSVCSRTVRATAAATLHGRSKRHYSGCSRSFCSETPHVACERNQRGARRRTVSLSLLLCLLCSYRARFCFCCCLFVVRGAIEASRQAAAVTTRPLRHCRVSHSGGAAKRSG